MPPHRCLVHNCGGNDNFAAFLKHMQNKWPCTAVRSGLSGVLRMHGEGCEAERVDRRTQCFRHWIRDIRFSFVVTSSSPSSSAVATRLLNMLQVVIVACFHS